MDRTQKQPQDPGGATGAQDLGNPRPGFMKCLLEVEEEKATHWRVTKARALPSRKSPRTLAPVPVSAPVGNSAPTLPLTLPQLLPWPHAGPDRQPLGHFLPPWEPQLQCVSQSCWSLHQTWAGEGQNFCTTAGRGA